MTFNKKRFLLVLLCCSVAVFWAFSAQATTWTASNNSILYGTLDQHNITYLDNVDPQKGPVGPMACGPASAVNSLMFLQNAYSSVYGTSLVPDSNSDGKIDNDDMVAVGNILAGPTYMKTTLESGTNWADFGPAIKKYTDGKAPGLTAYASATRSSFTWNWIYDQLIAGSDLEILIQKTDRVKDVGSDHYLTVYGLTWDDVAASGTLSYVDPWTGSTAQASILYDSADTRLELDYASGWSWIYGGESERPSNPVPEPSTLILLGTGMFGLALRLRKR